MMLKECGIKMGYKSIIKLWNIRLVLKCSKKKSYYIFWGM